MVARPLTPEELIADADLAGYARVTAVENGRAHLRFTRILKGRPKGDTLWHRLGLSRVVLVQLRCRSEPIMLGDWSDEGAYPPGGKVLTYLTWDAQRERYETMWWNGVTLLT